MDQVQPLTRGTASSGLIVSVVVPVRNGGERIHDLIDALGAQTLSRELFEVLIADDGSTDGATDSLAGTDGWLRVLPGPQLNSYAARNRAVAAATAPILAFCDVDCRPEPGWLEAGVKALDEADVVGGLIRMEVPERPSVWTLLDLDLSKDQERHVRAGKGETANLFLRRQLFERVGGFDASLPSGGDRDFVNRCVADGARLVGAEEAVVWHPTRDRIRPFLGHIWRVHRSRGARAARRGRRGKLPRPNLFYIPVIGMARSRRAYERSLLLDRRRLAVNGVRPTPWDQFRALPILYMLLPYVAGVAKLMGRLDVRRSNQVVAQEKGLKADEVHLSSAQKPE